MKLLIKLLRLSNVIGQLALKFRFAVVLHVVGLSQVGALARSSDTVTKEAVLVFGTFVLGHQGEEAVRVDRADDRDHPHEKLDVLVEFAPERLLEDPFQRSLWRLDDLEQPKRPEYPEYVSQSQVSQPLRFVRQAEQHQIYRYRQEESCKDSRERTLVLVVD